MSIVCQQFFFLRHFRDVPVEFRTAGGVWCYVGCCVGYCTVLVPLLATVLSTVVVTLLETLVPTFFGVQSSVLCW